MSYKHTIELLRIDATLDAFGAPPSTSRVERIRMMVEQREEHSAMLDLLAFEPRGVVVHEQYTPDDGIDNRRNDDV